MLLAVLSLAMGIQSAAVYSLGLRGVITTAATATWALLMGDLSGWSQRSDERFQLVGVLIGVSSGAIAGGLLMVHASDWAPILPLAVSTAVIAVAIRRLHPAAADHGGAASRDPLRAPGVTRFANSTEPSCAAATLAPKEGDLVAHISERRRRG